jgi:hypothetical protein
MNRREFLKTAAVGTAMVAVPAATPEPDVKQELYDLLMRIDTRHMMESMMRARRDYLLYGEAFWKVDMDTKETEYVDPKDVQLRPGGLTVRTGYEG